MANPIFIPVRFAANGLKNVIQKVLQVGQDPEDMTWNLGTPQITMIPKEDGGLPPKGQDFNGILYTLSDHAVQRQNGEQILFSDDVVTEYGGYATGSIVQSDDTLRHFRSLINNNAFNPNTQPISGRWEIYTGAGSIPTASSTTAGVIKVINTLVSTDAGGALSAAMGKVLQDAIASLTTTVGQKLNTNQALGVGQTWQNVTTSRAISTNYTNTSTRPIQVLLSSYDYNGAPAMIVYVNSLLIAQTSGSASFMQSKSISVTLPPQQSIRVEGGFQIWSELR